MTRLMVQGSLRIQVILVAFRAQCRYCLYTWMPRGFLITEKGLIMSRKRKLPHPVMMNMLCIWYRGIIRELRSKQVVRCAVSPNCRE